MIRAAAAALREKPRKCNNTSPDIHELWPISTATHQWTFYSRKTNPYFLKQGLVVFSVNLWPTAFQSASNSTCFLGRRWGGGQFLLPTPGSVCCWKCSSLYSHFLGKSDWFQQGEFQSFSQIFLTRAGREDYIFFSGSKYVSPELCVENPAWQSQLASENEVPE